jgi:hypothetical protein
MRRGYYDEESGQFIETDFDLFGFSELDDTSGTQTMEGWGYDPAAKIWTDPVGKSYNLSYLTEKGPAGIAKYIKNLFSGEGSTADYGTALAGLVGLYEQMNKDRSPKMWEGKVEKTPYVAPTVTPQYEAAVQQRPYGERVMGMDPFSYTGAVPTAAPAPTKSIFAPRPPAPSTTNTTTAAPPPAAPAAQQAASGVSKLLPVPERYTTAAAGGLMGLAKGGTAAREAPELQSGDFVFPADVISGFGNGSTAAGMAFAKRAYDAVPVYGNGDGMSDSLMTSIDGVQPAKVADGEAIVRRAKVAKIGGGDVDQGAKELYKTMDRVRQARTGTKKQGKQINPEKFTPGGIAGYAGGGAVAFQTGGATGNTVNPTGTGGSLTGGLSPWVGDYVAGKDGFLSKAWGLSEKPYEAYKGPLTAGLSGLQKQAIGDYGNLQVPGAMGEATQTAGDVAGKFGSMSYKPVGEMFGAQQAMNYMNPYLQAALDPQLKELTRQSDIARMGDAARLSQAGAFGGSRQAIMEAEGRRNLLGKQADVLGQGYATAYDKAMQQFNADQARKIGEAQYGADFGIKALDKQLGAAQAQSGLAKSEFSTGLEGLDAQMRAGDVQRGAEKENVAAQLAQWQESQKYPYENLKFMQSMLQGLPVSTSTTSPNTSTFADLMEGIGSLLKFRDLLGNAEG